MPLTLNSRFCVIPLAAFGSLSSVPASAQTVPASLADPQTTGEIRAMWVVRDSMTSPQKIKNAVALAKKYHFNTLFVQVRGRGFVCLPCPPSQLASAYRAG